MDLNIDSSGDGTDDDNEGVQNNSGNKVPDDDDSVKSNVKLAKGIFLGIFITFVPEALLSKNFHFQIIIKTDSAQSLSNKCKNYLPKIYSQHINFLDTI